MPDPRYLTDAEKAHRLGPFIVEYRFFVIFELRKQRITRWFKSAAERETFVSELGRYQPVIVSRGETP